MYQSSLKQFPLLYRGKVRDVYDLGSEILIVATDRISAFDVVFSEPIPQKGYVLTQLTELWLDHFNTLVPSQRSATRLSDVIKDPADYAELNGRSMVVKKAKPFPVEFIVRGYLLGTGYKDYNKTGAVCGIKLPAGLELAQKLPEPLFTPSTKAEQGEHDANISFEETVNKIGKKNAEWVRDTSLSLYAQAAQHAEKRGIIIADTKFEFGLVDDQPVIIDEVLTPDSSRFWAKSEYHVGTSPRSFDKQIVRDYLETLKWNKRPPAPHLPKEIIKKTSERYLEALEILKNEK